VRIEQNIGYQSNTDLDLSGVTELKSWFENQESIGSQAWFLAHAEDGVVWGRVDDGEFVLSTEAFPSTSPELRAITLIEARLFGELGQVHIWQQDGVFQGCRMMDQIGTGDAFDEEHRLWGTQSVTTHNRFTLISDGREGLEHAVPLEVSNDLFQSAGERYRPVLLRTRHFIDYDPVGQAYISASRLVCVDAKSKEG